MRKLNILIPSAHRVTHPSLCKCLRNNGEREIKIIGVDMKGEGIGTHIVDVFYQVPPRKDPGYFEIIREICKKESVDVYYALSEEEAISSADKIADFKTVGTNIITPGTAEMLAIATNKSRWHDYFKQKGVPHANYRNIESIDSIASAAYDLGYPEKDIVIKPAVSKGGRGARIITSSDLSEEYYTGNPGEPKISLESFIKILSPLVGPKFKTLIAMEYLPGTYYSVDVLSEDGRIIYAIPKIRIAGTASNTIIGQVDLNLETIKLAKMACGIFKFSYMQNYEMKLNTQGQPIMYDINPRGGASIVLCAAAGANLAYYAIKMAMGEDIPKVEIKDKVKMIRFYEESFEMP